MVPQPTDERLVGAAIVRNGATMYVNGARSHWDLRAALDPDDPNPMFGKDGDIEGFVTNYGRFVTRDEAIPVAIAAGQIHSSWEKATRKLLSSDVSW